MKAHFIAIGGSAMHNLAIALQKEGWTVTGSDDEFFEPSRSKLHKAGLLPPKEGWVPQRIHSGIDAVILGMHARDDNPELIKARELGIKIYSFPEFIYEQTRNKTRIVIGGSHGKTTITAMIMHVLKYHKVAFNYLVGAQLEGFDTMVDVSSSPNIAVIEGDEYLASAIDPRPKFHLYKPHIAVISGIEWDHMNVFPNFEVYQKQFVEFAHSIEDNGKLFYYAGDPSITEWIDRVPGNISTKPYDTPPFTIRENKCYLKQEGKEIPLEVFGRHNLQNLEAARLACLQTGITNEQFLSAISSFKGASKRLQLLRQKNRTSVYLDFAHAPSKLRATLKAVREKHQDEKILACIELHTFSSLNKDFLPQYQDTMNQADEAIVFYNFHNFEKKQLPPFSPKDIKKAFNRKDIKVIHDPDILRKYLTTINLKEGVLLMMSSGDFSGLDIHQMVEEIL